MTTASRAPRDAAIGIALLMQLEAASLAVMSALHLTGVLTGRFDPAGVAEGVIGVALLWGAQALRRGGEAARGVASATVSFAIAGFVLGLSFTLRGGTAIEIAYHAAGLPLLIVTLWLIRRRLPGTRPHRSGSRLSRARA
jgi:hypothetical protein